MNARLIEVQQIASDCLAVIQDCFKPGAKITLVVRTPGNDEADFVLTDDDMDEAIKALQRRAKP